jgi:hypothetical protein
LHLFWQVVEWYQQRHILKELTMIDTITQNLVESTPHTLDEAVKHIVIVVKAETGKDISGSENLIFNVIKDFMSQKFCVANAEAIRDEHAKSILTKLWGLLTRRAQ